MKYLHHVLTQHEYSRLDQIIYVLFCRNDKFYVGRTSNFESRMVYGHFCNRRNRLQYLRLNPPVDLLFYIETGLKSWDSEYSININDVEDYVTVIVSMKYGAENVFGGFRHIKSTQERIKFVKGFNLAEHGDIAKIVDPRLNFELPDLEEIKASYCDFDL